MKNAWMIFGMGMALAILSFSLQAEDGVEPVVAKASWEHMMVPRETAKPLSDPEFAATINRLGREGWQMVDVTTITKEGTATTLLYYFKRPL